MEALVSHYIPSISLCFSPPSSSSFFTRRSSYCRYSSAFFFLPGCDLPASLLRLSASPDKCASCHPSLWLYRDACALRARCRRIGVLEGAAARKLGEEVELEDEIYDFMIRSPNPNRFPTASDLVEAGRKDLVQAIAARGGWLCLGWNLEEEEDDDSEEPCLPGAAAHAVTDYSSDTPEETGMDYGRRVDSSLDASSTGRPPIEMENADNDAGVEGILRRLEKERSVSFGLEQRERQTNGRCSSATYDPDNRRSQTISNNCEKSGHVSALDPICSDEKLPSRDDSPNEIEKNTHTEFGGIQLHLRLRQMELKLKAALNLLKSKGAVAPLQSQEVSENELHRLYDAWEFKEDEIIKAQDKLRSIKAKLAILEGKMALKTLEVDKVLEEKQKRISCAQRALHLLRTACIIWPNTASEVLLCGSFDGWTSQRRMIKSGSGIFSIYLKLYPGQYEIKFIVDGVWRIDPLRPVVNHSGHENNLIVIS